MSTPFSVWSKHHSDTVNLESFVMVLFSGNFADADAPQEMAKITLSLSDVGKSCPSRKFFTWEICLLMLFPKIKLSR